MTTNLPIGAANAAPEINSILSRRGSLQILQRVIDQALNGDNASANLLLARAIPPLKPVGAGLEITGDPNSFGELATAIISALAKGGDAQAAKDALQALSAASRIYELSDLEDRVRTLEEQEKEEDEKRRERKERNGNNHVPARARITVLETPDPPEQIICFGYGRNTVLLHDPQSAWR